MGKGNLANLVQNQPAGTYSPETLQEWRAKGGRASGDSKRKHKQLGLLLRDALALDCDDARAVEELQKLGLDPSFANAATLAVLRKATHGDVEALRYVRDTIGEKPTEALQVGLNRGPVRSMDLTQLTDAELEALADETDPGE